MSEFNKSSSLLDSPEGDSSAKNNFLRKRVNSSLALFAGICIGVAGASLMESDETKFSVVEKNEQADLEKYLTDTARVEDLHLTMNRAAEDILDACGNFDIDCIYSSYDGETHGLYKSELPEGDFNVGGMTPEGVIFGMEVNNTSGELTASEIKLRRLLTQDYYDYDYDFQIYEDPESLGGFYLSISYGEAGANSDYIATDKDAAYLDGRVKEGLSYGVSDLGRDQTFYPNLIPKDVA